MKRQIIFLFLILVFRDLFSQGSFYKNHGFQVLHKIYPTHHVLSSSTGYHAAWSMQDYLGGGPLSTYRRIVLANYDKQGNYLSQFEVWPNQAKGFLLGAELIADSLFVFQIDMNHSVPKLICFNSEGQKKWETANDDIYNHFQVKGTTIVTLVTTDTGSVHTRTNLVLYNAFDFIPQDSVNIEDIKNTYFLANDNVKIKGLEISENYIVLFFENDSTKESEFLFFDFNLNFVKKIIGDKDVLRFFIWDEDIVVNYNNLENRLSLFSSDTSKNWQFVNLFFASEYKNIVPHRFSINSDKLMVLYNATRSSPSKSIMQLTLFDKSGIVTDTLMLDGANPRIHPASFIKAHDGYFFQTIRNLGDYYDGWICKVDSCFSTNSSDFEINLSNENCFQGTSISDLLSLKQPVTQTPFIYPNPVSSDFSVNETNLNLINYNIYDLNGRLLQFDKLTTNQKIDVSSLSSGIYFVQFIDINGEFFSSKIIKK